MQKLVKLTQNKLARGQLNCFVVYHHSLYPMLRTELNALQLTSLPHLCTHSSGFDRLLASKAGRAFVFRNYRKILSTFWLKLFYMYTLIQ